MMWRTWTLVLLLACEPPKAQQPTIAAPAAVEHHADACRDDIPDCAAACALRETGRAEFTDFYDRRCAAVILGKNPDKIEPIRVVTAPTTSSSTGEFPPDVRASLMVTQPRAPFDPTTMSRTGGSDPAECKAARILRAQKRDREADMLDALCIAKGGDAGT
jgi:hypothetical protein